MTCLRIDQKQAKGKVIILTKCGHRSTQEDTTIWWSDVDCTKCRPFRFEPVADGLGGMKMVQVGPAPHAVVIDNAGNPHPAGWTPDAPVVTTKVFKRASKMTNRLR